MCDSLTDRTTDWSDLQAKSFYVFRLDIRSCGAGLQFGLVEPEKLSL